MNDRNRHGFPVIDELHDQERARLRHELEKTLALPEAAVDRYTGLRGLGRALKHAFTGEFKGQESWSPLRKLVSADRWAFPMKAVMSNFAIGQVVLSAKEPMNQTFEKNKDHKDDI